MDHARHRLGLRRHRRCGRSGWKTSRPTLGLTDELLRRGYSEADVHKVLGANVLRAFRQAGEVAKQLQATRPPEVDEIKPERHRG